MLLVRARDDMPYVDLSAFHGACIIKNYRDEGGWGAAGLEFLMSKGIASSEFWPQKSSSRSNDTPEMWANAALHKFSEGWIDMGTAVYSRKLAFNQCITSLLCRVPLIQDHNFWGHSIAGCDAVNGASEWGQTRDDDSGKLMQLADFDLHWGINDPVTGGISIRIWNSWTDSWGSNGMGILAGAKAIPDGCTAPRVTSWSSV